MSPSIDSKAAIEDGSKALPYFSVELNNPKELDIKEFDRLTQEVGFRMTKRDFQLKYIVFGNIMYLFSDQLSHKGFFQNLNGQVGKLQSAGNYRFKTFDQESERSFHGYSKSLVEAGLLTEDESEKYKMSVLKESFGETNFYFT